MSAVDQSPPSAERLGNRLEFETLISDLSSRFISVLPGEVDHEIEAALRGVCDLLGIDLAVLWQGSPGAAGVLTPTHVYSVQEGPHRPAPIQQGHYPWCVQQVLTGRTVAFSSLEELPAEAAVDVEYGHRLGIKSSLVIPLTVGIEPPIGALALNAVRVPRGWPDGLVRRLQLVAQVFTNALARKRHELNLQQSEERLSLAADSAEAGLWTLDFSTGVFWATERARSIFGYSEDEVISVERFEASVHPDDRDLVRGTIERSRVGEPVDVEYRILLPGGGDVRWIASRGRPRFAPAGEPDSLMGVSIDITGRKQGEEALRVSQTRLAAGADLAGLGFYEVDFGERVIFIDDFFRDLCGVPPDRRQGLQPLEFWMEHLHPDDRQHVMDQREQMHAGRLDRLSVEYRFLHPVHGEKWFHHMGRVARRDASGRTVKSYGVLRDITERKRHEEALQQSYAEIERLKDRLQAESEYLRAEIGVVLAHGEVTGQSAAIKKVLRLAAQVAPTDSSVLIRGETGTGKELLAQVIHRLSPRRSRMMVKVNCAALPSGLVESELFGREKGAFTGALARQVGRFEIADGSTVFLDEVGELPLDVQVKLLRVLQEGEFERLGSPRTIKANLRVIAATNRDLADAVKQGRFREDLYYRLNVFPIRVPPLRERAEDIPLLVWTFLEDFSSRMGKKIIQVPRTTMETLQRHGWPGNVRELRNVIEHGAIITTGDTLKIPTLGEAAPGGALPQTLADAEREHILRTLETTRWRIKGPKGAAAALGLNPATLYSRMKKLGIRHPQ